MSGTDLGAMLLLGIVGSTHCLGMCGGFVVCLQARARAPFAAAVAWHVGRLLAYGAIGALLGSLGLAARVRWDQAGGRGALMVAGVLMALAGLSLLGLLPRVPVLQGVGAGLTRRLSGLMRQASLLSAVGVGGFTGLLPCGLLYAALARAVASASPWDGAALMAAFWLGTTPALLGLALLAPWLRGRAARWWPRVAGATVLVMGVMLLWTGLVARRPVASPDRPACCHCAP